MSDEENEKLRFKYVSIAAKQYAHKMKMYGDDAEDIVKMIRYIFGDEYATYIENLKHNYE